MNWEAVGAIGEIVGAAGVIITLLYLSIQLRQNTRASQITAIQSSMENSATFSELIAINEEVAHVFWQGLTDPEALSAADKRRFVGILNIFLRREAVAFYLHREGMMPDDLWAAREASFTGALNQRGLRYYLATSAESLPADFRAFLEDVAQRESTMPPEMGALFTGK